MKDSIDILGTTYGISFNVNDEEADGTTNFYDKVIAFRKLEELLSIDATYYARENRLKHIKRHELAHAFLFESGATKFAFDEEVVEWIATMFPKMLKTFQEIDAI